MATGDEIRIVYAYLETLERNARTTADSLEENSSVMDLDFRRNQRVQNAFDHFLTRWDRNRKSIRNGTRDAADAFAAVMNAFEATEDRFISDLEGGAASPTF